MECPIYFSSEEFNLKGRVVPNSPNLSLDVNNTELFLRYVNNVKNKIIQNKEKYGKLDRFSDKSLNQLFKYPLVNKNFNEYVTLYYRNTEDIEIIDDKVYIITLIPTHIIVSKDVTWKLMFTINKYEVFDDNGNCLFIQDDKENDRKALSRENIINAYL